MIKQFVTQGACLKCQGCCRFAQADSCWLPCLLDEDIARLKENMLPVVISGSKKIIPLPLPAEDIYLCPFLNSADNKCRIYALRPFECRLYPFLLNRKKDALYLSMDLNCPFLKRHRGATEFNEYLGYLAGLLQSEEYQAVLKNNPQVFQTYPKGLDLTEIKI